MGKKIIKGYNHFIAFLISILGIGGTISGCAGGNGACEYGTPHADFKINGTVINEDGNTIPGVKVKVNYDSTFTDNAGKYALTTEAFPTNQTFPIQFTDVDGEQNGLVQSLDTVVEFENPEFENGTGDWYEGETSQTFNISMKKEE